MHNYIIINKEDTAYFYTAENAKLALYEYATDVGFNMKDSVLKKVVNALELEEFITFFNRDTYESDNIKCVITGYATLYEEGEHA